jgi:putative CocE/NonD family hydrolase
VSGAIRPHAFGEVDPRAQQVWVEMRDGVRLATDVYLPDGDGPFPTVLTRLPYDKSGEFSFMSEVAERLTPLGLAVVVQDVRGKVRSEGPTLAFVSEVADGWDTLDWIAAQPWSTGAVGTFGDSYYGFTQWAMAFSGHPALKAMVPRMTTTEVGPDWMYLDGVFNLGTMGEWALHTWIDNSLNDVEIDWSGRPIARFIEHNAGGLPSKSWDEWIVNGPDSAYWTAGIYGRDPGPWGTVPTLHVGGWFDVFSRGQLRDFQRGLSGPAGEQQYLVMGALDHFDDHLTEDGRSPDYLRQRELLPQFLDGYLGTAIEFLSHVLVGTDARLPRVRWELGNAGWRESETWPPAEAVTRELHLTRVSEALHGPAGGSMGPDPEMHEGTVEWTHDPANPVPNLIEDPWRPLLSLPDERPVHMRPDVLTFTGEEQRAPLDLAGPVEVTIVVQAEAPSTHVVARLCDVFPDGRTHLIVEGAALVHDPAEPTLCRVDLGDTGYRVRPGHRLRLQVSASAFPRWIVHPGTAEDPFTATATQPVTHRLFAGGAHCSTLTLTALPGAGE